MGNVLIGVVVSPRSYFENWLWLTRHFGKFRLRHVKAEQLPDIGGAPIARESFIDRQAWFAEMLLQILFHSVSEPSRRAYKDGG